MDVAKTAEVPEVDIQRFAARVIKHQRLSETGYELVLERDHLTFQAGRLLTIHGRSVTEDRSYTIACGVEDEYLHVLYRLVPKGTLTPQLVRLQAGDSVTISGPYGQFVLRDPTVPMVFIATGTGIAPCRAYTRTYPELDLTIYHGVRTSADLFYRADLSAYAYYPCVTQSQGEAFKGRVTDLIPTHPAPLNAHYYLCGAYEMIYDVRAHLLERGVSTAHIFMEGYYYRPDG